MVSTIPANGAASVPIGQVLSATFSEAMTSSTISATTFTLKVTGGAAVAGTVTYSGVVATFTPSAPLAYSTSYTATTHNRGYEPGGHSTACQLRVDLYDDHPRAHRDGSGPCEWSRKCARRPGVERDLQRGDDPCHDQRDHLHADRDRAELP